ncbi:MAG: cytochrome c3 family protein, partial [Acidobacteriota bacterium]|nr:cytochrome c3 family protein [Acidobacteriota bacterium]
MKHLPHLLMAALMLLLGTAGGAAAKPLFNHDQTGFPLEGEHARVRCDSCHKKGIFKGTPKVCAQCHGQNSPLTDATTMTGNHMPVGAECQACHGSEGWNPPKRVDHSQVLGTCESCHDGRRATGKGPRHLATAQGCDSCHTPTGWRRTTFHHPAVTGNCVSCHNGSVARGKSASHIPSSDRCESCHAIGSWKVAHFTHPLVTGNCARCHNG